MGISVVRSGWSLASTWPRAYKSHARARQWLRTILYRAALCTLLVSVVGGGIFARAQEERPEFIPGERKVARKKDAGPRALAVLRMSADGKVTLVPVAILINGKFWDASAYKANPVPMALEAGTVYEGERTGSSVGLFTVGAALHSLAANAAMPWLGTGAWLPQGKDAPNQPMKAETVPVGIGSGDAPPRLTRGGASAGAQPGSDKSAGEKSAGEKAGTPSAPASSSSPSGSSTSGSASAPSPSSSGDEPPRLSRPAQSSGSGNSGSGQTNSGQTGSGQTGSAPSNPQSAPGASTPNSSAPNSSTPNSSSPNSPTPTSSSDKSSSDKSSSDKSADDRPSLKRPDDPSQSPSQDKSKQSAADKSALAPPESDSGAGSGYRPRLRRGKPATSFADEDIPGYGKPGATPSASAKAPAAAAAEIIDLVPAISDAGSNELHVFNFNWLKDEEGERRTQIAGIAKQELVTYLSAQAKATTTPTPASAKTGASGRTSAASTGKKTPEPILENVKMVAYDLWGNNTPVIVFSADAHLPTPAAAASRSGAPQSGVANEMQYSIMLVLRPDIYDTLRKLYVGVTDKYHLDLTPRLQLIDAVDADGDGRGELLFKEISDAGTGWILYRATADKLWKMFDSLSPE